MIKTHAQSTHDVVSSVQEAGGVSAGLLIPASDDFARFPLNILKSVSSNKNITIWSSR